MNALDWAQLVVLVLAAIFLLFKLWQGWYLVSMSLSGATERRPHENENFDDLSVAVTVTTGQVGSLHVHSSSVRISWDGGCTTEELVGTAQLKLVHKQECIGGQLKRSYAVDQSWERKEGDDAYRMAPKEATVWSCNATVPAGRVCTIEIVIVGVQQPNRGPGQWRASLVSLPVEQQPRPVTES
jgi:hypothetical protein